MTSAMQPGKILQTSLGLSRIELASVNLERAEDTFRLGRALSGWVQAGDFLALVGQLGAGKTTLVQGLVGELDSEIDVRSPTYGLVHRYATRPPILHIDLYRLEFVDELENVGYWDHVEDEESVICVEWMDRFPQAWPNRGIWIELSYADDGREVNVFEVGVDVQRTRGLAERLRQAFIE